MKVLLEIGEITESERLKLLSDLEDEDETGPEKLLIAIDQLKTTEKCKVFGRLCRLKALGKIESVDTFLRLTKLLQDAYLDDLILVNDFELQEGKEIHESDYYALISLGLLYQELSEQKPIEQNRRPTGFAPEFTGGDVEFVYYLTDLGQVLHEHYWDLFPDKKNQKKN